MALKQRLQYGGTRPYFTVPLDASGGALEVNEVLDAAESDELLVNLVFGAGAVAELDVKVCATPDPDEVPTSVLASLAPVTATKSLRIDGRWARVYLTGTVSSGRVDAWLALKD